MATGVMDFDVAKKKTQPTSRPKANPESERKPMALQMRGSEEWKAWLEELAAFDDRTTTSLGERALHRYAAEIGFPKKPPAR